MFLLQGIMGNVTGIEIGSAGGFFMRQSFMICMSSGTDRTSIYSNAMEITADVISILSFYVSMKIEHDMPNDMLSAFLFRLWQKHVL